MTKKPSRVKDAMAQARAVDPAPFDPSKVAGDTPAKAKRRARKPKAEQESTPPPIDDDDRDDAGDDVPAEALDYGGGESPEITDAENELAKYCAEFDQNDAGNGQRLIVWFGVNLVYVSGLGWLTWRGTHWQRDEGELDARRWAQLLVDKIKLEPVFILATPAQQRVLDMAAKAMKIDFDERSPAQQDLIDRAAAIRKDLNARQSKRRNFAVTSGNAGRTAAMLSQAASFKAIDQKLLDADNALFNVRNCTLAFARVADPEQDLEGEDVKPRFIGQVTDRPCTRDDMITKVAEVDYNPAAECPNWQLFLDRMMPDKAMQRFLQVFHAYAMLMGGNGSQKLVYHYGLGANGKSVFLETLGGLAGSYRTTVSPETITGDGQQRQGQQASPDIARLFNTRLVIVEELPKGVPLKENLVKAFSGGTPMTARFLQKEFFEFVPIFVAVLSGNTKPAISGSDKGIWRRVFIVHWSQTIAEDDPSRVEMPQLLKRFEGERAGILNWLIEGAKLYLADGLMPYVPDAVKVFTEAYRQDRDNIEVFCGNMIVPNVGHRIQAGHLYKRYTGWCEANGLTAAKQRTFGDRLGELGFKKDIGRVYEYLDISVRAVPEDASDPGWTPPPGV